MLAFTEKAKAARVDVTTHVEPGMVHVYPMFAAFSNDNSAPMRSFEYMSAFVRLVSGAKNCDMRMRSSYDAPETPALVVEDDSNGSGDIHFDDSAESDRSGCC